jgi:hypothetical protein
MPHHGTDTEDVLGEEVKSGCAHSKVDIFCHARLNFKVAGAWWHKCYEFYPCSHGKFRPQFRPVGRTNLEI